jgi:type II secretory pathway pseudopilin PulG
MKRFMRRVDSRDEGALLVELMVALTLLSTGLLAFFGSFTSGFRAGQDLTERDEVRVALENVTEALRRTVFTEVYADFEGAVIDIPYLKAPDGSSSAACAIKCYVNETALPAEFGPVLDIDGNAGLTTLDCKDSYKLLPVRLTLRYATRHGPETRDLFLVLGGNS